MKLPGKKSKTKESNTIHTPACSGGRQVVGNPAPIIFAHCNVIIVFYYFVFIS